MQNEMENPLDLLKHLFSAGETIETEEAYAKIEQHTLEIAPALVQHLYSIENEPKQRLFIRNFHAQAVALSDKLFEATGKRATHIQKDGNNLIDTPRSVLLILEDLPAFIWSNYPVWCDQNQKLPRKLQMTFLLEIAEKLESLSLPGSDPDHGLYEKVKASVQFKLNKDESTISYGMMDYLNEFVKGIGNVRSSNRENSLLIPLKDILIAFNFNSLPVGHYLISEIDQEIQKTASTKDKIERLHHWQKEINQVPVKPDYAFDLWQGTIGQFLSHWVGEEIRFYEESLLLFSGSAYPIEIAGSQGDGFKLETDMSVTQIACMTRLLMECGVVKNNNIRELLNFVAKHTRSKKQVNISAESLRMKYYNIEEATRNEVIKIISGLLKHGSQPM